MADMFEQFVADVDEPFSGWDFSYVAGTGRLTESPLPWSYASILLPYMWTADAMLDMGTGGGELLAQLRPWPPVVCATEGYPPNVPVARARLEPLGASVVEVSDDSSLSFPDQSFDLVINRHESYSQAEVRRILRPGGHFITQQVGGDNDNDLNRLLGAPDYSEFSHWDLDYALREIREAGFDIVWSSEAEMMTRFYDIGAVIYYLRALPWQCPDFSTERYRDELLSLYTRIQHQGYVDVRGQRFIIIASC